MQDTNPTGETPVTPDVSAVAALAPGDGPGEVAAVTAAATLDYPELPQEVLAPRQISGQIIAYASPDSTYAVTRRLIDGARHSVVIGIYDFSAGYMRDLLKRAMRRGVRVSLMLDTNSGNERRLLEDLKRLGAVTVVSPSTTAHAPLQYFRNAHEKIIVIDDQWVLIQSGNWSENSIPFNEGDGEAGGAFQPGNRDTGLAVQSPELAEFFAALVRRDMDLATGVPVAGPLPAAVTAPEQALALFESAPTERPPLIASRLFTPSAPVPITPVLSPDNYQGVVPGFLASARQSIRIQQQYIRGGQAAIDDLLRVIAAARERYPDLAVRVMVSPKNLEDGERKAFLRAMDTLDLQPGTGYRFLSLKHFVHCHNKLIVVDDRRVLVGSQNWSSTAVLQNREASLLVEHEGIASYFAGIFDSDWELSAPQVPAPAPMAPAVAAAQPQAADFAKGGVVESTWGDYADV